MKPENFKCPSGCEQKISVRKRPDGHDCECLICGAKWAEYNEKQSEQKPQFTEEQFDEMLHKTIPFNFVSDKYNFIRLLRCEAKQKGYIIKSSVEEAEEMYKEMKSKPIDAISRLHYDLINKQHEAIQYLKKNK